MLVTSKNQADTKKKKITLRNAAEQLCTYQTISTIT